MLRETVSAHLDAPADAVFRRLIDIEGLPDWNHAITDVVEVPHELVPAAVWKVRLHALGQSWVSKSTLLELDESRGRFRHRSKTDDGNPSFADWEWHVAPETGGSRVDVVVDLHPLTFWRKYLLVHVRRPALRREMKASLSALTTAVTA